MDFLIKLLIDRAQAENATTKEIAELVRLQLRYDQLARHRAASANSAADAAAAGAKKGADASEREYQRLVAAGDRLAAQQAAAARKAADAQVKEAKRAADKQVAEARRAADADAAAQLKMVQDADKAAARWKGALSPLDLQRRASNKAQQQANDRAVRDAAIGMGYRTGQGAVDRFGGQLGGLVAGFATLGAVVQGLHAVAGAFRDAYVTGKEYADKLAESRDDLRAVANLRGTTPQEETEKVAQLRRATGLKGPEARQFIELMEGAPAVDKARFPEAEQAKYLAEAGKFAVRVGGSLESRGRLAGLLPSFLGGPQTAAGNIGHLQALEDIAKKAAGKNAEVIEQFTKVMAGLARPEMVGAFKSPEKAMAMTMLATVGGTGEAAQSVFEQVRELRGFTKWKTMKGVDASQAQTLKAAGIEPGDEPDVAAEKLFRHVQGDVAGMKKAGGAFDVYMSQHGFRNIEANRKLGESFAEFQSGRWQQIMGMADRGPRPGEAERLQAAFEKDPTQRRRKQLADIEAAEEERGKINEPYQEALAGVRAQRIREGITENRAAGLLGTIRSALTFGQVPGAEIGEQERVRRQVEAATGRGPMTVGGKLIGAAQTLLNPFGFDFDVSNLWAPAARSLFNVNKGEFEAQGAAGGPGAPNVVHDPVAAGLLAQIRDAVAGPAPGGVQGAAPPAPLPKPPRPAGNAAIQ